MRKNLLFTFILILSFCMKGLAQQKVLRGRVMDASGKETLIGVSVRIKGTNIGTSTNSDGQFTLNVPSLDGTLVLSFMGYKPVEVAIAGKTNVNISMEEDANGLNDVVVVGYGTQKRKEISGSIASVKGAEIANLTTASVDRAIQGKAPGVQINSSNGLPGGATEVRIRGTGSINAGNEPLYIVDGVQITSASRTVNLASSNPLSTINPNDIESVEILKDAAAASIYGAQAGNGVIIITTKSGKDGKAKINFGAYYGITELVQGISLLNGPEWVALSRESIVNTGNLVGGYNADVSNGLAANAPTYDWLGAITRQGRAQNYDLSVTGGNDKMKYLIASSFNNQEHHFKGYDFKRGSLRVNLDNKITDKLSLETRLNLSSVTQNSSDIPSFQNYNIFITGLAGNPIDPIYNADGTINTTLRPGWDNPLFSLANNKNLGVTNQGIGNMALNYDIIPGLRFRSSFSLEYTTTNEELFYDPRSAAGIAVGGAVKFNNSKTVNWQTDQTLTYNKIFAQKHSVTALLGFNYRNEIYTLTNTQGNGVAIPDFGNTLTGTTPSVLSSLFNQFKTAGVFARLGYTYDDKYILQGTVRRDGSSRFGDNNRFGVFPAISGAWRINRESFLKDSKIISDLKLRASYGETGNSEISFYPGLSLVTSNANASYNSRAGIIFNQLGNSNVGWERNVTTNFGLDYGFFNGRVTGSFDYFIRTTKDLLLNRPLPNSSGFATIAENIGSLENRGLEVGLSTINLAGDFKWTTDFNITFIKNKVLSLLVEGQDLPANNLWVGRPLGQIYVPHWAGVNPADGRPMWYDANGNITYNPVAGDRQFTEDNTRTPRYYGGLTNNFSFKNFDLSVFFQYQVGTIQQDQSRAWLLSDFRYNFNQYSEVLNRWTTPGQITDVPRLYAGAQQPGTASSVFGAGGGTDRFYSDASYLRLKSISLGYNIPASFLSKIKMSSLKFYVQAYNLWTLTNYTGLDPEFAAGGYNMGLAPQGKSFTAGLQASF